MSPAAETRLKQYGPLLQAGAILFGLLGGQLIWPEQRISALEIRVTALELESSIIRGLGRIACQEDRLRAELADIPCSALSGAR